jgi:hypothetical protein
LVWEAIGDWFHENNLDVSKKWSWLERFTSNLSRDRLDIINNDNFRIPYLRAAEDLSNGSAAEIPWLLDLDIEIDEMRRILAITMGPTVDLNEPGDTADAVYRQEWIVSKWLSLNEIDRPSSIRVRLPHKPADAKVMVRNNNIYMFDIPNNWEEVARHMEYQRIMTLKIAGKESRKTPENKESPAIIPRRDPISIRDGRVGASAYSPLVDLNLFQ